MALEQHTIVTPAWLRALIEDVVVEVVTAFGFMGPIGFRYEEPADDQPDAAWVIHAYPTPNEVRGCDANDGMMFVSGFSVNLGALLDAFQTVTSVTWHSPAQQTAHDSGPKIVVQGTFLGRRVALHFFRMPPADEPPAFAVNPRTSEATELSG